MRSRVYTLIMIGVGIFIVSNSYAGILDTSRKLSENEMSSISLVYSSMETELRLKQTNADVAGPSYHDNKIFKNESTHIGLSWIAKINRKLDCSVTLGYIPKLTTKMDNEIKSYETFDDYLRAEYAANQASVPPGTTYDDFANYVYSEPVALNYYTSEYQNIEDAPKSSTATILDEDGKGVFTNMGLKGTVFDWKNLRLSVYGDLQFTMLYNEAEVYIDMEGQYFNVLCGSVLDYSITDNLAIMCGLSAIPFSDGKLDYKVYDTQPGHETYEFDVEYEDIFNYMVGVNYTINSFQLGLDMTFGAETSYTVYSGYAF